MTRILTNGEEYTELQSGTAYFLKSGNGTTGTNFTLMPGCNPVNPVVNEMESTQDQTIEMSDSNYIMDNNLNAYYRIVGGRVKGKPRR